MDRITLRRPDDFHVHLRDGPAMASVLADTARRFARAIVMPNLKPPMRTTQQALHYRDRILGEDSLPLKSRLTKDQLEAKYKADRAAAEDNLIPIPNELAERLGLPIGTRVSWEQLQKTMGKQPI